MIRPQPPSLAVLATSTPFLSLFVFIYAILFELVQSQCRGSYGDISLHCLKLLSVEFG